MPMLLTNPQDSPTPVVQDELAALREILECPSGSSAAHLDRVEDDVATLVAILADRGIDAEV